MTSTGITHCLTLPEANYEFARERRPDPLRVEIETNALGITISVKDPHGFDAASVFLEHYCGKLQLHAATARNSDEPRYHITLGRAEDGILLPLDEALEEELEVDQSA
jgi:hypothetical protein